ncbi:alpha/beta hydrolase family esterase [Flagellimonas sp.]|uniref:alpha/beta hydrolase family esterase n=1 Tax=Flagellimonas sp. TaxID=2058762 RepID=UPI003B50BE0A
MKRRKHLVCSMLFLVLCTLTINAQWNHEESSITDSILINGAWRNFEYHLPQFPSNNARLVFVFHDNNMTPKVIQEITGFEFNKLADKTAATMVVYPHGHNNLWNLGQKNVDDIGFIKSIVQRMERRYHIDRKNVFAVGYFNGANMCYKLAGEIPDIFKGFAVIGANMPLCSNGDRPFVPNPVSIMIIDDIADTETQNTDKKVNQLNGIALKKVKSANEALNHWINLLGSEGAAPKPTVTAIERSNSQAIRYDYSSKEKNKMVSLLKIIKGGYCFPNPNTKQWPQIGDETNKQINIPEIVVNFFYQIQYQDPLMLGK